MDLAIGEADGPLSLYFRLRPGEKADLEVAAQAAIAWASTLRAAALAVDPESELRIEIVDANESSLIVNAILRWVRTNLDPTVVRMERGAKRMPKTFRLALAFAPFLIFTAGPTYKTYFDPPDFTPEDHAELAKILEIVAADHHFQANRKKLYRAVERDTSISGVGVKRDPKEEPVILVESKHFAEAGGLWAGVESEPEERTTSSVVDVILVKPALVAKPASWTFEQVGVGQFDAVMKDYAVLDAMGHSGLPERLRQGIPMKLRLEVHEVAVDGDWKVVRGGRVITHVISPAAN